MAIKAQAALVPRHYMLNVTASPDSMLRLIINLDRFVDEFDADEEVEELLGALKEAFAGDLPQPIVPPDEPPTAAAA